MTFLTKLEIIIFSIHLKLLKNRILGACGEAAHPQNATSSEFLDRYLCYEKQAIMENCGGKKEKPVLAGGLFRQGPVGRSFRAGNRREPWQDLAGLACIVPACGGDERLSLRYLVMGDWRKPEIGEN